MWNFSESKAFFENCHLSVLLIKSWDRMGVNEKLCCVPQNISGHRREVPQEINLLTSRKLYELTKQISRSFLVIDYSFIVLVFRVFRINPSHSAIF